MQINPFQAVYPNLDFITSADSFFGTVKEDYNDFKKSGFFHKSAEDAIYIYRIKVRKKSYTGIIGCATVEDYLNGKIKKHENTLAAKEQQQLNLMIKRGAAVKPILLAYPNTASIDELIQQQLKKNDPFIEIAFEDAKEVHTLWKLEEGLVIQQIQQAFQKHVPHAYIADGHHRSSTSSIMAERMKRKKKSGQYNQILAAFFPITDLTIYDYNRVVDGIDDRTMATFMAKISQVFEIDILKKAGKPKKKFELTMAVGEEWFKLKWKKKILEKYKKKEKVLLDANLLDYEVMRNIMEIEDTRTDERITYVEGPKGYNFITKKTRKNENKVAFCLYPVAIKDLFAIADANLIMPPKSTWFEPRVKNGLLVLEF